MGDSKSKAGDSGGIGRGVVVLSARDADAGVQAQADPERRWRRERVPQIGEEDGAAVFFGAVGLADVAAGGDDTEAVEAAIAVVARDGELADKAHAGNASAFV